MDQEAETVIASFERPPIVEVVAAVDSQDYQGPSVQGVELR